MNEILFILLIEGLGITLIGIYLYYLNFSRKIDKEENDKKINKLYNSINRLSKELDNSILNAKAYRYRKIPVEIIRINENAIIPKKMTDEAAGCDLYACLENNSATIKPHQTVKINTGIKMAIPQGYFGAIYARSGLATKDGLRPANCVGVIDSDYRGEIIVALFNDSNKEKVINTGDRIAQLVIQSYQNVNFIETRELDETDRGNGGFGSSGIN